MKKIEINYPFLLESKVLLNKNHFEGGKINESGIEIEFYCGKCKTANKIKINSNSGALIEDLVRNAKLTPEQIIESGLAKESTKMYKYLGDFTIIPNLSALFETYECDVCGSKYIVAFAFGESQPSRNICSVSGIWRIDAR